MSDTIEKIVIIGSGPAAWSAAIYAARANLNPVVYEGSYTEENRLANNLPMGQLYTTTEIENYPGFPHGDVGAYLKSAIGEERSYMLAPHAEGGSVTGPELVELIRQQAANFGTRVIPAEIVDLDVSERPFKLTDNEGETCLAQTIIIATGARANWLGLPSEEEYKNRGVSACAVCDGALPRFRNKPLAVIGGGDSAIEEALYLTNFASKVYLIHRRDEFRASKAMAKKAFDNEKIEILFNNVPIEFIGNDKDGLTNLKLKSTTVEDQEMTIDVSGAFCAIGHTPNTAFLQGKIALTEKRYVQLPQPHRMATSVPGIFAAGDCADDYYRQAITSAGTGAMAALEAERFLAAEE